MQIVLTLPIVPSVNHCYLTTKYGQKVLTKKGKDWKSKAQSIASEQMKKQNWELFVGDWNKKIIMDITAYYPDKRIRDMHNMHKLLPDSLEGILFDNDRWLLIRDIDFFVDKDNPRVEVVIKEKE